MSSKQVCCSNDISSLVLLVCVPLGCVYIRTEGVVPCPTVPCVAGIDVDSLMECAREGFVQASQRKPSAKSLKVVCTCWLPSVWYHPMHCLLTL